MTAERRVQRPVLRFLLWFVAPLDDRLRGLSMARLLSFWCFGLVTHSVWHERAISGWDYATLVLGAALWVGKKAVLALIYRNKMSVDGKEIRETVDVTVRQIQERRDNPDAKAWDAEAT